MTEPREGSPDAPALYGQQFTRITRHKGQRMTLRRYRTHEVTGSSPASSIRSLGFASAIAGRGDFRPRSTINR
jgi:hypothetical protein